MADTRSDNLAILVDRLEKRLEKTRWNSYRIPTLWNAWGYPGGTKVGRGEIEVNPYECLLDCIWNGVLLGRGDLSIQSGRSLSKALGVKKIRDGVVKAESRQRKAGDWLSQASFYGMLVRTTTAWDHDGDGDLKSARCTETGTFLKSILLLPHLAKMGITAIYMLPVCKHSNLYLKGGLGCPYSAKNFFELEPTLHDKLLGPDVADLEMEFGAFVEAAHHLGIRVLIDLAPRTASRDADMILDHPDWFYWIDAKQEKTYGQPYIEGADYIIPPASALKHIHSLPEMQEHRAKFRFSPNITQPTKWKSFAVRMKRKPPRDLLKEIRKEFGIVTPPGFSDVVNDKQPPWSDVTFLRYYLDHPASAQKVIPDSKSQPPYVYSEVIKSSMHPGRKPNKPLWKSLAGILPFYQKFGVDGARIDMGHALPSDLEGMILKKARQVDPDFGFIAEELGVDTSAKAKRGGYNMVIGPSWWMEPRAAEGCFHAFIEGPLQKTKLPVWATAETPDTPRAVVRAGNKRLARMAAVVNPFLPNAASFTNTGSEVYERQPMNLGLDVQPRPGRFALKKDDPYYGKLAFFDPFVLHWENPGGSAFVAMMQEVAAIRKQFSVDLVNTKNSFIPCLTTNAKKVLAIGWKVDRAKRRLFILANTDFQKARRVSLKVPARTRKVELLLSLEGKQGPIKPAKGSMGVTLPPGGVRIILV